MSPPSFATAVLPPADLRDCQYRLIWANERCVEPQFANAKLHASSIAVAWLILKGSTTITDSGGSLTAPAGNWVFPRKADAQQAFSAGARILSVRFAFRNRRGEDVFSRDRHRVIRASATPQLTRLARSLVRAVAPWMQRGSLMLGRNQIPLDANLAIDAAFLLWLRAYAQTLLQLGAPLAMHPVADARVRKAIDYIDNHPMHQRFKVSTLAAKCGLGVNRLGSLFQLAVGRSPLCHYDSLRLERAMLLLADDSAAIKEIAWALGFGSQQHFSNWFKDRTGQSPSGYRSSTDVRWD